MYVTLEKLKHNYEEYETYPRNVGDHTALSHQIDAYYERLGSEEDRLFDAKQAAVDMLDVSENSQESADESKEQLKLHFATTLEDVQTLFENAFSHQQRGVEHRYIFIHARHSRAALRISRDMLTAIFSYYQISPTFLDFIFPFGKQEHSQDGYFGGFREENRLYKKQSGPVIPSLNRSGRDIRLCYNLRSVEQSPGQQPFSWSIRQTSVYHSFDVETGQVLWINIKGNQVLRSRILEAANLPSNSPAALSLKPFSASLATHLLFAEWAGENWRWYIKDLEAELHNTTSPTLAAPVSRASIANVSLRHSNTDRSDGSSHLDEKFADVGYGRRKIQPSELPPHVQAGGTELTKKVSYDEPLSAFSFSDLQRVHFLEEKLEEARVVLELNDNTLRDLRQLYHSVVEHSEFPEENYPDCKTDVMIFEARIRRIEKDANMQRIRLGALSKVLKDRRVLLDRILQFQNAKSSQLLAQKAQQSADSMETMTVRMHEIAVKTKQETVSMRIVTIVTLFFLPGTFVATFMSTDVLQFSDNRRDYQPQALMTYLAICLPLTTVTFLTWYLVARTVRYKDNYMRGTGLDPITLIKHLVDRVV